jgi:DNA-directed RNA polymerase subunit D
VEIEVLEKDNLSLRLLVRGTDVPFMNALRRTVISEVPCMAVDEIVILENSSILQDEMIAHRLGLVPLKTDLDSYNLPEECECKSEFGCNLCRVTLTLDAESKEGTRAVYSGEMVSENPNVVPVSDKIPILKLAKEQKIRLEAYARLERGKTHAKWQPVSMCAYKYFPKIEISKKCDVCGKCIEACPKQILIKTEGKMQVKDVKLCTLCQDCVQACPKESPAITVNWEPDTFILNLESSGALPPERIITEAVKIMDKQLKQLGIHIKVRKSEEA